MMGPGRTSPPSSSYADEFSALREAGLYRRLMVREDIDNTKALIDGVTVTVFGTNDYLGLSRHPKVIEAGAAALTKHGASAGASRLVSGNVSLYRELETRLADLKKKEAALVFSSGYMANLGLLSALAGPKDLIIMDKLNHASLYDAARLSGAALKRYAHNNLDHARQKLSSNDGYRRRLIVTDGVFSADGDLADLPGLSAAAAATGFDLIVDDAHGTGVMGPDGRGTAAHLNANVPVEIGTLSKAIGALGGFVAADRATIDLLINKSRTFIFTTGLPPSVLAGAAAALDVMAEEPWRRQRVLSLSKRVRESLAGAGFTVPGEVTPIIPIIVGDERSASDLAAVCRARGVFVPAIRYPTVPKGSARLRLTVCAAHSDGDIADLLEALSGAGREMGII